MAASTALQVLVSPLLGVVFESLGSLIQKEFGLVLGVNKDLEKLSNTISTIRDVLEDAEVKQIDDKPIYNWLRKLKDLAYETDDILDECATKALILESDIVKNNNSNIQVTSPSHSSCFNFKSIMFRHSIGKRIKKLLEKFDEMAELRNKFHLNLTARNVESRRGEQRETSSFLTEPKVYGREEEKEHITNLLLDGGGEEDLSVYCIVGMGGLGKTTLAQLVYNDENIANHFKLRCWVCVSDDFVLKKLLKSIIEYTGENARDLEDLAPLQHRVQEIFTGKKFLLVLDDVWNEDQTKWYNLKSLLSCGGKGSSIIVTTRLESVALITSTFPIRRLESLPEEECWSLFKHHAFEVESENNHPMLEEIGKEIVKKCGGLPLAAKALGGLLRFKKKENEWLFVRDSTLWDLPQNTSDAILPALRLSYYNLPSHLKECFSYCSIFPKNYILEKELLIHLWMANGFVLPKGNMGLEDIGDEIFNELLWRSLLQDAEKDKNGDILFCKMHDLVHDLACSITLNECTFVEVGKDKNVSKPFARHLLLDFGFLASSTTDVLNLCLSKSQPLLRTFFQTYETYSVDMHVIQELTFSNLKCLRVLDLSRSTINALNVSIGHLKHLRYLDLSYCKFIKTLPDESICNLRNLQVLKLDNCENLQVLPKNMRKMTNLRHLGISECNNLRRMPVGMGNLSCLRILSMFIVAPKSGCGITELQGLDHLGGELKIQGLEHVRSLKDAEKANLMRKKRLRLLSLVWSGTNNNDTIEVVESVGEGLKPHPNLKGLHLNCYNGLKYPSWMSHSCLPNLVKVSLEGCRRCEHLPPLGQLPFLEVLKISGMDSLKCIGDEFYGEGPFFPTLKELEICNMPDLKEWCSPQGGGGGEGDFPVFPSLELLMLQRCPKLRTAPSTLWSSLKKLTLAECNEMLILEEESSLLENLPSTLTELQILACGELVCLPEEMQNLTSLKSLDIFWCPSLKYLPELGRSRNTTVMTTLSIGGCAGLTSVFDCLRHLSNLESLEIYGCPKLEFLQDDFQDLTSLRSLMIKGLPKMTCLPEGLQQVAGTLEHLSFDDCCELTSLPEWMHKFTSLQGLAVYNCKNLNVLPEQVLHLTNLRNVSIRNCHPDLHRIHAKETGEDWNKIAHIPDFDIPETTMWETMHVAGERKMKCINSNNNNNNIISCLTS